MTIYRKCHQRNDRSEFNISYTARLIPKKRIKVRRWIVDKLFKRTFVMKTPTPANSYAVRSFWVHRFPHKEMRRAFIVQHKMKGNKNVLIANYKRSEILLTMKNSERSLCRLFISCGALPRWRQGCCHNFRFSTNVKGGIQNEEAYPKPSRSWNFNFSHIHLSATRMFAL